MQLKSIDKQRYQTRSRYSYFGLCTLLIGFTLLWSNIWIYLFSSSDDNFLFNFLGVLTALVSVAPIVYFCKNQVWFDEVFYVWNLKRELNKINRKMSSLSKASNRDEPKALTAIKFSYQGSRQIWQLDDNTLMLHELDISEQQLDQKIAQLNLSIDIRQYRSELLNDY